MVLHLAEAIPLNKQRPLLFLLKKQKSNLDIVTYTGYTYEYLIKNSPKHKGWAELLNKTDILVDGRYELDKKNLLLRFRGSENQRIINLKKTRTKNKIVFLDEQ